MAKQETTDQRRSIAPHCAPTTEPGAGLHAESDVIVIDSQHEDSQDPRGGGGGAVQASLAAVALAMPDEDMLPRLRTWLGSAADAVTSAIAIAVLFVVLFVVVVFAVAAIVAVVV